MPPPQQPVHDDVCQRPPPRPTPEMQALMSSLEHNDVLMRRAIKIIYAMYIHWVVANRYVGEERRFTRRQILDKIEFHSVVPSQKAWTQLQRLLFQMPRYQGRAPSNLMQARIQQLLLSYVRGTFRLYKSLGGLNDYRYCLSFPQRFRP